jgi:hypothetical protein
MPEDISFGLSGMGSGLVTNFILLFYTAFFIIIIDKNFIDN